MSVRLGVCTSDKTFLCASIWRDAGKALDYEKVLALYLNQDFACMLDSEFSSQRALTPMIFTHYDLSVLSRPC